MSNSEKIKSKLSDLPKQPGVYFMKDLGGKIIYIGKAAVLKNRVSSYFQTSRHHDQKTQLLVADIADLDWITVESEVEALFLESEFIKRYKPKYNIDLKDDKHFIYIKITMADTWPVVSFVRRPLDDKAQYFGPYTSSDAVRKAMKQLRKAFPYVTHSVNPMPQRACLHFHLGLCPGPEVEAITSSEYKKNLRRLIMYLSGQGTSLIKQLQREMDRAAKIKNYELAAARRDQLRNLKALSQQMIFGDRETFDLSRDQALVGLSDRLGLPGAPRRIEAYDISHLQGSDNVASMVVFQDGVPNKEAYRRFKMRLAGNDDFAHMREVMNRRFSGRNLEQWPKPDLILIDGGKGQLAATLEVMAEKQIQIPTIGLAKREEEIIRRGADGTFTVTVIPHDSHVLQLLQRVRDEAHRFAVTYHGLLRSRRQTSSILDAAPGIGAATRKRLIKQFGSVAGVKQATPQELAEAIGPAKAKTLHNYLHHGSPE